MIHVGTIEGEWKPGGTSQLVHTVLESFDDVFHMPADLPLKRSHEHATNLREGRGSISVRPYRYPHVQKDEIERLVREMFKARVI